MSMRLAEVGGDLLRKFSLCDRGQKGKPYVAVHPRPQQLVHFNDDWVQDYELPPVASRRRQPDRGRGRGDSPRQRGVRCQPVLSIAGDELVQIGLRRATEVLGTVTRGNVAGDAPSPERYRAGFDEPCDRGEEDSPSSVDSRTSLSVLSGMWIVRRAMVSPPGYECSFHTKKKTNYSDRASPILFAPLVRLVSRMIE